MLCYVGLIRLHFRFVWLGFPQIPSRPSSALPAEHLLYSIFWNSCVLIANCRVYWTRTTHMYVIVLKQFWMFRIHPWDVGMEWSYIIPTGKFIWELCFAAWVIIHHLMLISPFCLQEKPFERNIKRNNKIHLFAIQGGCGGIAQHPRLRLRIEDIRKRTATHKLISFVEIKKFQLILLENFTNGLASK